MIVQFPSGKPLPDPPDPWSAHGVAKLLGLVELWIDEADETLAKGGNDGRRKV